jgi:multiple sugar transport system substrate-binding protein
MQQLTRRQLLRGLLAGGLAGVLAACAKPTPTPTPRPQPTTAPAQATTAPTKPPAPTAVPQKINFVLSAWGDPETAWGKYLAAYIDKYQTQHPNVTIEYQSVPWAEYPTKLLTQIAGGTAPDTFAHSNVFFPQFIAKGGALELQPFIDRTPSFAIDDFFPASLRLSTYKGKLYGLPHISSAWSRVYNKNMFQELGIPDPNELDKKGQWTWETFLDAAQQATKRGADGKAEVLGFGDPGLHFQTSEQWMWQNGGDMLKQPNLDEFVGNMDASAEAVQFQADLINRYKVSPVAGEILVNAQSDFNTGRIAMYDSWANMASLGFDKFDHGDLVYPAMNKKRVTILHTNSLGVFAKTKYPEACWELIALMAGPEGDLDQVNYGVGIALRKSNLPKMTQINREKYHVDHPEVIEDVIATGRTFDITEVHNQLVTIFGAGMDQVRSGQRTAKEVLDEIKPNMDAELAKIT